MKNQLIFVSQIRIIQDADLSPVRILHYLPNEYPLPLLRKFVGQEIMKFTGRTILLKKGDFIYAWDNLGVIDELYDNEGNIVVFEGIMKRIVKNKAVFRERFGIGESVSTVEAASPYPAYPAGTSSSRQ